MGDAGPYSASIDGLSMLSVQVFSNGFKQPPLAVEQSTWFSCRRLRNAAHGVSIAVDAQAGARLSHDGGAAAHQSAVGACCIARLPVAVPGSELSAQGSTDPMATGADSPFAVSLAECPRFSRDYRPWTHDRDACLRGELPRGHCAARLAAAHEGSQAVIWSRTSECELVGMVVA